jgi:hypothetical protein
VGAWAQPWKTTTLDAPVRVDLKMATRVGYDEAQRVDFTRVAIFYPCKTVPLHVHPNSFLDFIAQKFSF